MPVIIFNLLLGEKQAEEIKIKIGSAIELHEPMLSRCADAILFPDCRKK